MLSDWAGKVERLHRALAALDQSARALGVQPPQGQEWFELLEHKLLPQLSRPPLLVVAVVGGTNIGKSVIFNHLAGESASGVSPLAAGTRHPVCLVPPHFEDQATLAALFEGFALHRWQSDQDPLGEAAEHRLFWRASDHVPQRLLLLDTPDIDSDASVNWQRADLVRQAADVLVAVLTQQKYNDAAVKQFFRKAAQADKPVVVVFNQVDLEEDRAYWGQWLHTFASETGVRPELTYVVPYDRPAARELELPFFALDTRPHFESVERESQAAAEQAVGEPNPGAAPHGTALVLEPAAESGSLREELAALHFDEIKIRTFRGAIERVTDRETGAAGYLEQIRRQSAEFAAGAAALSASEMARVQWPTLPPRVVVEEIRRWWDEHRSGWSRAIHSGYRWLGRGLTWPLRAAWHGMTDGGQDPLENFLMRERTAVITAVENLIGQLERLAKVGNPTLQPRLANLLRGESRDALLARVVQSHSKLPPVSDDYRAFLEDELSRWEQDNPRAVSVLRSVDYVAALARPAITISLCVSGWIVAGGIVQEAAMQAATQGATHLATEAAITGGIAGGGEMLVSTTSEGLTAASARLFTRLQTRYAELRSQWLADWLERELLGDLLQELRTGAEVPEGEVFQECESALAALSTE